MNSLSAYLDHLTAMQQLPKQGRWNLQKDGRVYYYDKKLIVSGQQKIEKVLEKINSDLGYYLYKKQNPITLGDKEKLQKLKQLVEIKVENYLNKHQGYLGRLYIFVSKIIYGDINKIKKNTLEKIEKLEIRERLKASTDSINNYIDDKINKKRVRINELEKEKLTILTSLLDKHSISYTKTSVSYEISQNKIKENLKNNSNLYSDYFKAIDQISNINQNIILIKGDIKLFVLKKEGIDNDPSQVLNKIEKICQLTGIKFEGILFNDLLKALKKWIVKNHPDRTSNLNPQFSEVLKKRQALENFVGQTPSIEDLNKSFNKIMTFKSKLDRAKNN